MKVTDGVGPDTPHPDPPDADERLEIALAAAFGSGHVRLDADEPRDENRIGKYRIVEKIGEGGMGEVFAGNDETLHRKVALKSIREQHRLNPDARARFIREARILSALDHAHICRIYDYVHSKEGDYLVLEWVDGESLHQTRPKNFGEQLRVAKEIADALDAAHAAGIVHRDLKPANVMLTEDGAVKVLDFGIAHADLSNEANGEAEPTHSTLEWGSEEPSATGYRTELGSVLGTLDCMSPEQARGEALGPASDVFSLGLLLRELFTGKPGYGAELPFDALFALVREGQPNMETPELDRDLSQLLLELTDMAPARRPTARQVLERLRWIENKPRRRRIRLASAAAVVATILAGVKYVVDVTREKQRVIAANDRSELRRAQAVGLLEFTIGDLSLELDKLGRLPVIEKVHARALEYFASVPADELTDGELSARSKLLYQIGEMRLKLERLDDALGPFELSRKLASSLVSRHPNDGDYLYEQGQAEFWVGFTHYEKGEVERAETYLVEYLRISERLLELDPENQLWRLELPMAQSNLITLLLDRGQFEKARMQFAGLVRAWRAERERVAGTDAEPDVLRELADSVSWLAEATSRSGDLRAASETYREALELQRERVRLDPENIPLRARVATELSHLSRVHGSLDEPELALDYARQAMVEVEELLGIDPSNAALQREVAVNSINIGGLLTGMGRFDEALEEAERGLARAAELHDRDPENTDLLYQHARAQLAVTEAMLGADMPVDDLRWSLERTMELADARPLSDTRAAWTKLVEQLDQLAAQIVE